MENIKSLGKDKRIAMIAHDYKKKDLIDWAVFNKTVLSSHSLVATGTTGKMLEKSLGRPVTKLLSGPLGGDQQIGAMIANGEIDMVIFFWDPMEAQPHDSDVKALLRTADFLITSPFMHEPYDALIPDYTGYLGRPIKEEK